MKILLSYMKPKNSRQQKNFDHVYNNLRSTFNVHKKNRDYLNNKDCKGYDLICVLGGDGTFLRTSHHVKDKTPLLGINLDNKYKEGFLLETEAKEIKETIRKLKEKNYTLLKIPRLQAKLGGKILPHLALNEFYIGFEKAYFTARYEFTINGKTEFQKSSGILVGTSAGSHGWIKSAGGKTFPITDERFQMIVREPYCSNHTQCTIKGNIFKKDDKLRIRSEMKKGIIVADSLKPEYTFNKGHIIEISQSKKPVRYIKLS